MYGGFEEKGTHPNPQKVKPRKVRNPERKREKRGHLRETKEYVVNMISEDFVEAASCCCGDHPPEVDEFELLGLTKVPSISLPNFYTKK